MTQSRTFRRHTAAGILALALPAGACAAPAAGPLADATTSQVADRTDAALRWRPGAGPSDEEETRVRALLGAPLTEASAVEVALIRRRRLQALVERAIAAAYAAHAEAAPANPVADLALRFPRGAGDTIVEAGFVVGLLDLVRWPCRLDEADLAAREASLAAAAEIVEALAEVRRAWVEAVAARAATALERDVVEAAHLAAELAARQVAAGTASDAEAGRHAIFRDEARVELGLASAAEDAARERFVRAMGLAGEETPVTLPAALAVPAPAAETETGAADLAVGRRLDLERARVAAARARAAAGIAADARLLPDAEAGAEYERDDDGGRSAGPSITLELPLSARAASRAASLRAEARALEHEAADLAARVRSEAREALSAFRGACEAAALLSDRIVPLRAAAVAEAQLRYNGMLLGVQDLLAEKREELRARRAAVEAVRDARLARIRLDLALGGAPVPPGVDPPRAPGTPPPGPHDPHHGHGHRHGGH